MTTLEAKLEARRRLPKRGVARQLRQPLGITQQDIADELGVTRECVARWERAERVPRGDLLERYVAILDRLRRHRRHLEGAQAMRPHPFRDAAVEVLDAIRVDSPIGRDNAAHWVEHYLGAADEDRVLGEPIRVWDRLRDLAKRLERLEAGRTPEAEEEPEPNVDGEAAALMYLRRLLTAWDSVPTELRSNGFLDDLAHAAHHARRYLAAPHPRHRHTEEPF